MQHIENYIDGKLSAAVSGEYIENFDPSTGRVYSHAPDSDNHDVELAVTAAKSAFSEWSSASAESRHDVLTRVSRLIDNNLNELAAAESIDNGKPLSLAKAIDIP